MGPRARARGNPANPATARGYSGLQWGHERALVEMVRGWGMRPPVVWASMGPRARARGNNFHPARSRSRPKLQWGHERALVEISTTNSWSRSTSALQWGHERALVEIHNSDGWQGVFGELQWGHERALVEMKSGGLHEPDSHRLQWGHERALVEISAFSPQAESLRRASMGPRARARGNTAANIQGINENALQWGHERALVEIPLTTEEKAEVLQLQWGHERALVEITPGLRQSLGQSCFNGATSARSWKSVMSAWKPSTDLASMGPRARARGNEGSELAVLNGGAASMGPRARARGNHMAGGYSGRQLIA